MASGNGHNLHLLFTRPVTRAVSLVPSITQSLIDLDCADTLVGVTEYCPQPDGKTIAEIIGGTHTVDLEKIRALDPELVLANQEENDQKDVEALEESGVKVWVSFPKDIRSSIDVLWAMARVFGVMKTATPKILLIERSLEWVQRGTSSTDKTSVFVPIWQDQHAEMGVYWITFNSETYCDSVLNTCGGQNVFEDRNRRYPLDAEFDADLKEDSSGRDTRYPRVTPEEVNAAAPEMILLPSEPFVFSDEHQCEIIELLQQTPAVKNDRVIEVDGRWLGWHGTMLAHALAGLPALFDA